MKSHTTDLVKRRAKHVLEKAGCPAIYIPSAMNAVQRAIQEMPELDSNSEDRWFANVAIPIWDRLMLVHEGMGGVTHVHEPPLD